MSYTPPAGNAITLDFSGSYTPPAGDAIVLSPATGLQFFSRPLGQAWALTAIDQASRPQDFAHALTAPVFTDREAAMAWALRAAEVMDRPADQGWDSIAQDFFSRLLDQSWHLESATLGNLPADQRWQLLARTITDRPAAQLWSLEATAVWTKVISATAYIFALEQGGNRAEIPIENFSGQFRSGEPSYLQVSIPDAWTWAATIADYATHADTEMVINAGQRWSDDSYTTQEIARVTLRNVQQYFGARSASVNLDGTDTRTNATPTSHTLTGASYYSIDATGQTRYRCQPDFNVRPGDTVTINGETLIVGELNWQVSANNAVMEVAERLNP